MKCPGCDNAMLSFDAGGIELDVCRDHCGGVWFDPGEFERYDEAHESVPEVLLQTIRNATTVVDRNRPRPCPRCAGTTLEKRFFDSAHELQIDQCPKCAGIFLDPGELNTIREDNRSSAARKRVVDSFYESATKGTVPPEHQRGLKAVLGLLFK